MNENCKEIWADIKDYEGLYQISNFGRVRNLKKKGVPREKILKSTINGGGYYRITLIKGSKKKHKYIHRLVVEAFIGDVEDLQVDHINRVSSDNRLSNLRIATLSCNHRNTSKQANCSSKYKGVNWDKGSNKWRARTRKDGKSIHLGLFDTELEAALHYDKRVTELALEGYTTNKSLGLL